MNTGQVEELLDAKASSDGNGVRLTRVFGVGELSRFDPFLMLDEFGAEDAVVGKSQMARLSRLGLVKLRGKGLARALLI